MDKKELNDLIDRVVLTGPGGVDKIKKILKEIVNRSEDDDNSSDSGCTCLSPMIVEGTVGKTTGMFTPASGSPTFAEAYAHMLAGGLVYLTTVNDGEPVATVIATAADPYVLEGHYSGADVIWANPDPSQFDTDEPLG